MMAGSPRDDDAPPTTSRGGPVAAVRADPQLAVLALAAIVSYLAFWPLRYYDVWNSYAPWLRHIVRNGPLEAFSAPFGDYTPPYYYLLTIVSPARALLTDNQTVKLASVIATLALAFAVARLLATLGAARPAKLALWFLLVPGIMFNAVLSASADALWAAPSVMALIMAIERRHRAMLIWCGVAAAIKAQAMFVAPFFLALVIARRVPFGHWLLAPLAALALYVPALLCGWPLGDLLTVYLRQAGFFDDLSLNAPNILALVQLWPGHDPVTVSRVFSIAAVVATIVLIAVLSRRTFERRLLVAAAALTILIVVGLLPRMHERYFYLADVLMFAYAASVATRRAWIDAALVLLGSTLGIAAHLLEERAIAAVGAVAMMAAVVRLIRTLSETRGEGPTGD